MMRVRMRVFEKTRRYRALIGFSHFSFTREVVLYNHIHIYTVLACTLSFLSKVSSHWGQGLHTGSVMCMDAAVEESSFLVSQWRPVTWVRSG